MATQLEQEQGIEGWMVEAVRRQARNDGRSLDPFLITIEEAPVLPGTQARCRSHFVRTDPQGVVRVPQLINMLTDLIVEYCIPRSRIDEALGDFVRTRSPAHVLRLQSEAKDLFTKIKTSGEGGELLLYALLEIALGLPQILCKMSLKTSKEMHYHGVDGVHAQALPDGSLAVYWGEAKLYAKVNQAIDAALTSLAPFLLDDGSGAAQRDVLLLREYADIGDDALTQALVRYFTEDTMQASQLVVRGACLIGFSMANYPQPFDDDGVSVRAEMKETIKKWQDRVGEAIASGKLASFELEVFFVPLPSVQDFRNRLTTRLGLGA